MDNVEITKLLNDVRELVTENERLLATKDNATKITEQVDNIIIALQTIIDNLNDLSSMINPSINIKIKYGKSGKTRNKYLEVIRELYDKMIQGTHVTRALIEITYNYNPKTASDILFKLGKMSKVEKVRDGRTIRLFIR